MPEANIAQMSINTSSGELKDVPKIAPVQQPAPQEPEKAAAAAQIAAAPEPKQPDPLSKGFAVIARKEKEFRQRVAQHRAKEQEIVEREAQIARFEQLKHQNPLEAIKALGLTYEDMVNFQLSGGQQPTAELEIKNIKEQMAAYVQQQEAKEQQALQARQAMQVAQNEQTIANYRTQLADFVKAKPDTYEMINIEGEDAVDLVYETVQEYYNAKKEILPMEKAAEFVEDYLTKDVDKKRMAKKFASKDPASQQPQTQGQKTTGVSAMERAAHALTGPRPTLNNSMTGSTSPNLAAPRLENDRMARAMAALDKFK